jgi:hypothetical protein
MIGLMIEGHAVLTERTGEASRIDLDDSSVTEKKMTAPAVRFREEPRTQAVPRRRTIGVLVHRVHLQVD